MNLQNIVGWETVQPDGSIVDVDAKTQPELAKAMRGGGNQFGASNQRLETGQNSCITGRGPSRLRINHFGEQES